MGNFYDEWLGLWDKGEREKKDARRSIHEEEIEWVETVQDWRAALLVSRATGFRTWGTTTMIAEIPPGSHSGQHKHGEEAIYIVEGTGYSVVDDVRYDWKRHSTVLIPFGSVHQHFNTGQVTARYLSAMSIDLEHYCGLHRTIQLEPWGATTTEPDVPRSEDGRSPEGNRVVLFRENAISRRAEGDGVPVIPDDLPEFDPEHPLILGDIEGGQRLPAGFHKSEILQYMRIGVGREVNDYHPLENEISGLLTDGPHEYGGMHAHMEAHLYILKGTGYSLVDGEKVPWKEGTCFMVPGPQTAHRHVNESDEEATMVRIAFGIRYFFERIARREFPYLYLSPRQAVLEKNLSRASGRR